VLVRAIRQAERDDLVGRNVASLVKPPKGQGGGRPSKSLTLEQAVSLMAAARGTRLEAYVVVSLLSARGVPVEAIALLAGHNQTATTELVYRHQIVPALTRGAEIMDQIFG
jgi:hypothetical protein